MLIEIHAAQSGPRQADSAGFGRFGPVCSCENADIKTCINETIPRAPALQARNNTDYMIPHSILVI
jgi:hypothetical protein